MKKFAILIWLLLPLLVGAYHLGPGQHTRQRFPRGKDELTVEVQIDEARRQRAARQIDALRARMGDAIIGQREVI